MCTQIIHLSSKIQDHLVIPGCLCHGWNHHSYLSPETSAIVWADHILIGSLGPRCQIFALSPDIIFKSHSRLLRNALRISGHISGWWQRNFESYTLGPNWDRLKHSKFETEDSYMEWIIKINYVYVLYIVFQSIVLLWLMAFFEYKILIEVSIWIGWTYSIGLLKSRLW